MAASPASMSHAGAGAALGALQPLPGAGASNMPLSSGSMGLAPMPGPPPPGSVSVPLASGQLQALPPPVCPSLILPNTEARFLVNMESLLRLGTGKLAVRGTSGRILLEAMVKEEDGRRKLALASVGCEDDPRVRIQTSKPPGQALEVYGRENDFYGTIESGSAGGGSFLVHAGKQVMSIDLNTANPADLQMTAFAMGGPGPGHGRQLGSAGRSPGQGGGSMSGPTQDNWRVTVKPGADAMLITSCMLSMALLRQPGAGLGSGPNTPMMPFGGRGFVDCL